MLTRELTDAETTLLQLLRYALCDEAEAPVITAATEWETIFRLSQSEGVAQIVWHGVERLMAEGRIASEHLPTKRIKLQWAYHNDSLERRYKQQKRVISTLATTLCNKGANILLLKGYGLSICYPRPEERTSSDVDIYLLGNQELGNEILERELGIAVDNTKHLHTTFKLEGIMVENHFDFLNIYSHRSNRAIDTLLKELTEESVPLALDSETIYIPSVKFNSLYLLRHAASHFAAVEIVLRHIVDCHAQEIDWEWLRTTARRYNMESFLDVLNSLSWSICGIDPNLTPGTTPHPELEERILRDILSPEFDERERQGSILKVIGFKLRRWWAHRWKHRMVYSDSLVSIFINQIWSHILKPNNLKK